MNEFGAKGPLFHDTPFEGGKHRPHVEDVDVLWRAPPSPPCYSLPLPEGSWQAGTEPMIP